MLGVLDRWTPTVNVLRNSYTMGCPPVRRGNPRALASGLSYVRVDKHGITILYHLHQCGPSGGFRGGGVLWVLQHPQLSPW